jgi:DNA ligase-associated metallophosphoesterase
VITGALDITWNGADLTLLPQRAILRGRTLYVADLHLGKPERFRAAGAPVPEEITARDLARLSSLIQATGAERVVVIGDLVHDRLDPAGETARQFRAWRGDHANLDLALVRGNHDRGAAQLARDFDIADLGARAVDDPLALVHDPACASPAEPTLTGHVHPAVRLARRRSVRPSLRAACFWFAPTLAVLPAFGGFTGTKLVAPGSDHLVFMTSGETVIDVTRAVARPRRAI